MEIYEDEDITFSGDEEDIKLQKKHREKPAETGQERKDPGTRVIYVAPETGTKRKFTGFTDDKKDDERIDEESVFIDENKGSVNNYTGGFAFEEQMRKQNKYPERRPPQKKPQPQAPSLEEEMRRRYAQAQRKIQSEDVEIATDTSDDLLSVEEIRIDDKAKKKPASTGDKIRKVVLAVSVIAIIIASGVLVKQYIQYRQGSDWEKDINDLLITEADTTKKQDKPGDKEKDEPTTEKVLTVEEQWAQLKEENPNITFPQGLSLRYAKMYAVNQDFVGYIEINEFGVGLPVVQSQKDTDTENYYLRRSFYKEYSVYGCPFVPKTNDMLNLDRNTVIYGHNNNSNLAFAPINKYKTVDGFKEAPVITFDTIYGSHKWKVFAVFIINVDPKDDNDYVFPYTFTKMPSDAEFSVYLSMLKQRSLYETGVDVISSDKILTLSTCTHDFDDARFVVVARLVRPGESEEVNTSLAYKNENPRYPQAYYDAKKKKNPYKDAVNWYYNG